MSSIWQNTTTAWSWPGLTWAGIWWELRGVLFFCCVFRRRPCAQCAATCGPTGQGLPLMLLQPRDLWQFLSRWKKKAQILLFLTAMPMCFIEPCSEFGSKVFVFTAEFTEAVPLFIPGHPYKCWRARLSYCNPLLEGVRHNSACSRGLLTDLTVWVMLLLPCFPWFLPAFASGATRCSSLPAVIACPKQPSQKKCRHSGNTPWK